MPMAMRRWNARGRGSSIRLATGCAARAGSCRTPRGPCREQGHVMKLLRTIRFDESDARVFPDAADPGEWAVPGTFVFADADPETLSRQERQAFANGFL
ncbi:MAG: DUF6505 family protein, partial [Ferrovibrio sp.]